MSDIFLSTLEIIKKKKRMYFLYLFYYLKFIINNIIVREQKNRLKTSNMFQQNHETISRLKIE